MGHRRRNDFIGGEGPQSPWQSRGRHGRGGHGHGGGWGGPGGPFERPGGGPPPWLAGLFGFGTPDRGRGPRVRRGDVRTAILDVLAGAATSDEAVNGYQVIQQIAERSNEGWRPSPGSVYPTIQQLEDEGLVETDQGSGRKSLRLTDAGRAYVEEHADEVAAVWAPFERTTDDEGAPDVDKVDLRSEIGQVMPAVWQIVTSGSEGQRQAAMEILADTRRRLYGVLADGPDGDG